MSGAPSRKSPERLQRHKVRVPDIEMNGSYSKKR